MMKKGVWGLGILSTLMSVQFVAAENVAVEWGRNAAQGINSFLDIVKVNPTTTSTVLMFALLWIIIFSIVHQFLHVESKKGGWLAVLVAAIITGLVFLGLPEGIIPTILTNYGAMGATLLTIIPFVILFYFTTVVSKSEIIAHITWALFAAYYLVILIYKIATLPAGSPWTSYLPYGIAFVIGIIMFGVSGWIAGIIYKEKLMDKEVAALRDVRFRKAGRNVEREEARSRLTDIPGGGG